MFWMLALALTAATLAGLVPALWRGGGSPRTGATGAPATSTVTTLDLLREQLATAGRDHAAGRIDAASAQSLRAEISRRLLEEHAGPAAAWHTAPARTMAWAVACAVPLLAVMLYGALGTPQALTQPERVATTGQPTMTQIEAMVSQMTQALEARAQRGESPPEDGPAWAMAARTLATMQRFQEADRAFARAPRKARP